MRKPSPLATTLAVVAALALLTAAPAAAQIVVGQLAPTGTPVSECEYPAAYDEVQTSVTSGTSYTIPTAGVLTSWSTNAGVGVGQILTLKVFRPTTPESFQVVARDLRPLTSGALNTFPVSIPVQAGDIIGLNVPAETTAPTACTIETKDGGDAISYREGDALVGESILTESFTGYRLNVSATVLPPPTVSAVSPAAGSVAGAAVTIAGTNFAEVKSVTFGAVPAQSFTVDSESQITAAAPASKTLAKVPVTVTTSAGAASSAVPFAYEGCKVPKLTGKKLKAAKKKLKKGDCKAGKVKKKGGATAKTGKVTKQSAKPGAILAPGTKVKLTLKP